MLHWLMAWTYLHNTNTNTDINMKADIDSANKGDPCEGIETSHHPKPETGLGIELN